MPFPDGHPDLTLLRPAGAGYDDDLAGFPLRAMPYAESRTGHSASDFPHACYGDGASGPGRCRGGPGRTRPGCAVQINHLGGALARPAPNAVPYREGPFPARLLTAGERARAVLLPAFALPAEDIPGRSLAFGTGDRSTGPHAPGTRKRLARVEEAYDPANLFRRNCGVY